ncbi:MAG: phage distal tail protein [Rhodoglobus sp.]
MVTLIAPSYLELNGLVLTALEDSGVRWATEDVDGWEGSPGSTLSPVQKTRGAGAWAGNAFTTPRNLAVPGAVSAPTKALLSDAIDRLNAACALSDVLLNVVESGRARSCMVRRSGEVIAKTTDLTALWSIQLVALNPRKFSEPLSASTGLPASSGGLTVPFTVPFTIDAVQVSGQVSLTNPGNETGPVVLRIDGPCNGPSITHVSSGLSLTFSSSLVLGEGEWLTIDLEARTVLANDQASRSIYITSRGWFGFPPGDSTFAFTANSFSADALLTVTATPAYQ